MEAFHQLDFDSLATELHTHAPDLYHFFMTLGDIKGNQEKYEVTVEEIKA